MIHLKFLKLCFFGHHLLWYCDTSSEISHLLTSNSSLELVGNLNLELHSKQQHFYIQISSTSYLLPISCVAAGFQSLQLGEAQQALQHDKGELLKTSCTLNLLKPLLFWSLQVPSYIWLVCLHWNTDKGVFVSGRIHQSLVGFLRYIYLHAKCWSGIHFWYIQAWSPWYWVFLKKSVNSMLEISQCVWSAP